MTVRINKKALNLREELTKAQGVVRYEQRQFWMDGLVENGTFDNGTTGWDLDGSGVSISNGQLIFTSATGTVYARQDILSVGKKYKVDFTISNYSSGSVKVSLGSSGGVPRSANGTYSEILSTTLNGYLYIITSSSGVTLNVDNIAVFEVDENDNVIHSVPLGFKPVHVYEDGLIQREGDVHDYTVVNTGGAYAIKPAVQPTGSTETCIIAEREL